MAGTGQGAGADDGDTVTPGKTTDTAAKRTRSRRRPRARATKDMTAQRVDYVLALLVGGYGPTKIVRKVTAAHANEAEARQKRRDTTEQRELERLPALLWGDEDEPPCQRSVERWIAKAKEHLADRGQQAARLGDRLFGLVLARIDETYQVARATKNPSAMARSVEVMTELFAFDGAVRPALSALAATGARTGEAEPPPDASMTEDSAAEAAVFLLERGRQLRAQALAAQQQAAGVVH